MQSSVRALIAAALTLAVAVGSTATAQMNTVTTNNYSKTSTSGDIARSCKEFWVAGGSGVIEAKCNTGPSDDKMSAITTTYDADNAIYCPENLQGGQTVIAWGSQSSSDVYEPTSWSISLNSTGGDYIIKAVCDHTGSGTTQDASTLDLGDTTSGLKNNDGKLAKR